MKETTLSEKIRNLADSHGIDILGFAEASEFENYMLNRSKRRDPKLSLPDAKTIIVVGIYIGGIVLPSWSKSSFGRTSRLYLSGFFLDVVKPLEPIAMLLRNEGYRAIICDDSVSGGSIIPLKLAAVRAGLGWQGKHSLLINEKYGTFLALGGMVTNAGLEHNKVYEKNRCGKCQKCQEACPCEALDQPYMLNRKRCLSNLLQNDNLPEEAKAIMENRVIDCEICQEACPWNESHIRSPLVTKMTSLFQNEIPAWEDFFYLPNLAKLTEKEYRKTIAPLNTGIPYEIFRRNVLIAMERMKKTSTREERKDR